MNLKKICNPVTAFFVGLLIGGVGFHTFSHVTTHEHNHDQHPIADPYDTEYHVHTDFHIVINGTKVDLSGDEFQTTSEQTLHEELHLHDNNGEVVHIHAESKTFVEFLDSVGISLTNDCVTLDNQYCSNEESVLQLYVNNEPFAGDVHDFIPLDDDRVLLYYGTKDPAPDVLNAYLEAVPHDSCYYSGTCPERGIAPPESCGLTCEL